MKTKISLALVAAFCSASLFAQEAMNVEAKDGKILKSAALSDNMVVTFSDDEEEMVITENGSELKRIAIESIGRITFGELKAESNATSQITSNVEFSVYGSDEVRVACDNGIKSVAVYGTDGKLFPTPKVQGNPTEFVVSLASQPKGICIVVVETAEGRFSQKVNINK